MTAGAVQREAHPVFLGLALAAQAREGTLERSLAVPDLGSVGPWRSASLDKHTSEGKKAVRHQLAAQPDDARWLRQAMGSEEMAQDALGRLWFWMEGGLCDRIREYPTASTIDRDAKRCYLTTHGLDGSELFRRFGQPSRWHAARLAVVHPPSPRSPHP